jgi:hypothetical protein
MSFVLYLLLRSVHFTVFSSLASLHILSVFKYIHHVTELDILNSCMWQDLLGILKCV